MISASFQFRDQSQKHCPTPTYQRFYDVISKNDQLASLILNPYSYKQLITTSTSYKRMMLGTLTGSILVIIPMNKYLSLGSGFLPKIGMFAISIALLTTPMYFVNSQMKTKMKDIKKKVYDQNRASFRKYELTGDILQANSRALLVE